MYVPTLHNYRNLSFATNFVDEVTSKNGATSYEEIAPLRFTPGLQTSFFGLSLFYVSTFP